MLRVPAWIRRVVLLFALTVAALQLIPAPGTPILAVHAAHTAEEVVADTTYALDLRVDASLRLFGTSDPAGETELKDIAQRYPSYARAPFYLGLMAQTRGEPEIAVGYYAAVLRADPAHPDATNNIAAVLTNLPPSSRARMAEALGLVQPSASSGKDGGVIRDGGSNGKGVNLAPDVDIDAVDMVVEGLFRRTLEVDGSHRWALNNLGLHLHSHGRNSEAVPLFSRALELYPREADIHFNLGVTLQMLGRAQEAAQRFTSALECNPKHVGAALNLAALHHQYGVTGTAIEHYRRAAALIDPADSHMTVMLRNNLGTALFQAGEHTLAKREHLAVLELIGTGNDTVYSPSPPENGEEEHDIYIDTLVNLHRARKASCDWRDWERLLCHLKRQVDVWQLGRGRLPSLLPFDSLLLPNPVDPTWRRRLAEAHSSKYAESGTNPVESGSVIDGTTARRRATRKGGRGAEREDATQTEWEGRRDLERWTDGESADARRRAGRPRHTRVATRSEGGERLDVGFIGHDFDEHPTAQMMEGVFVWQRKLEDMWREDRVRAEALEDGERGLGEWRKTNDGARSSTPIDCCRYSVYSYGGGRGDGHAAGGAHNANSSRARESIRSNASAFVELFAVGHEDSVARLRADGVDILVDLQGHTLGGRSEIAAARPARLQVSYLVFPGTSGAPYMDYLISDRHITPPEHANHYSESLVLLPRTYQANTYEGETMVAVRDMARLLGDKRASLRRMHGLPDDLSRAVFANFNKIDKLDPESFSLWMQILRRVPGSVLWLLDPRAVDSEIEAIRSRLGEEARSRGVDRGRVVWAKRMTKSEHLLRLAAADLFLDTLVYGAHSTATDALAGGLPLLTIAGGSFPSRVGVSLLRNAGPAHGALLVAGQREYEDLAVKLVSTSGGWKILRKLRRLLLSRDDEGRGGNHQSRGKSGGSADNMFARAGLRNHSPLFDTKTITTDLNRAFMLMSDAHDVWEDRGRRGGGVTEQGQRRRRLPHIVLTDKTLSGIGPGRRT